FQFAALQRHLAEPSARLRFAQRNIMLPGNVRHRLEPDDRLIETTVLEIHPPQPLFRNAPKSLIALFEQRCGLLVLLPRALAVSAGEHHVSQANSGERLLIALHRLARQSESSLKLELGLFEISTTEIVESERRSDPSNRAHVASCELQSPSVP